MQNSLALSNVTFSCRIHMQGDTILDKTRHALLLLSDDFLRSADNTSGSPNVCRYASSSGVDLHVSFGCQLTDEMITGLLITKRSSSLVS
jgi:hypothetical protein